MTDSRSVQQQSLLEQLASALENQHVEADDSLDLRRVVAKMMEESRSWDDDLHRQLVDAFGETLGGRYAQLFSGSFPSSYRARFGTAEALDDIRQIQSIAISSDVPMGFYHSCDSAEGELNFKLYSQGSPVILSDVIPILENLGMRVLGEHPYRIQRRDGEAFGVSDFTVAFHSRCRNADFKKVKPLVQEAFREIWNGFAENDEFQSADYGRGPGMARGRFTEGVRALHQTAPVRVQSAVYRRYAGPPSRYHRQSGCAFQGQVRTPC